MGLKSRISARSKALRGRLPKRSEGRLAKRPENPSKGSENGPSPRSGGRLSKRPRPKMPKRPAAPKPVASLAAALWKGVGEVFAIAREMLSIAATVALGVAERIGNAELVVIRRVLVPAWRAAVAFAAAAIRLGAREITPVRATTAVSLFAIAILAASQFAEYREVRAGVPAYAGVESVAGAPRIEGTVEDAGQAHAYLLLPLAAFALAFLIGALRGRWRLARLLALAGLVTIAVGVLVDAPNGLDEGVLAIQFDGAEARLLAGFWTQLCAGIVLLVAGPLLAAQLNPARSRRRQSAAQAPPGPSLLERIGKRVPFRRGSSSPAQVAAPSSPARTAGPSSPAQGAGP